MMLEALGKTYNEPTVYSVDLNCPVEHTMIYRCFAYAQARKQIRGNLIFLDTDVIALRPAPLDKLFNKQWDIGLVGSGSSGEPYVMMPYCGGFIAAHDTPEAQVWFDQTARAANAIPAGMLTNGWWVDQLAMAWAADHVGGLIVENLDTSKYNYVPVQDEDTDAYFVHLKGPRKPYMKHYLDKIGS